MARIHYIDYLDGDDVNGGRLFLSTASSSSSLGVPVIKSRIEIDNSLYYISEIIYKLKDHGVEVILLPVRSEDE